ncbi:class F sortase [Actinoplanes sp. CA-030573]|uniref:class F sortase n=1 Tax=Actinoplanes sp. CA-030573 TaxID=3239898 RepID=UPI003D8DF311
MAEELMEEPTFVGVAPVPGALSVPRRPPPAPARSVARGVANVAVAIRPIRAPVPEENHKTPAPVRRKARLVPFLRRAALPAGSAVLAAFVVGTTYVALAGRATDAGAGADPGLGRWAASAGITPPAAVEGAGNAGRPPGDPFASAAQTAAGVPTRVRVSAIGLDSPLETLHIAKGALQPPTRFDRAGWYADGTAPGDTGPAVIAGHVDSKAGPAVFYRLRELTTGDTIEVLRGGRTLRFTVTRTAWYPKRSFPTEEVYGPTPDRQLRLITCGGVFDHRLRSYQDNLVVYAVAG